MARSFSLGCLFAATGLLTSCTDTDMSISPRITIMNAGFVDTIKVTQRYPSSVKLKFTDDNGLANYHIRINDSIYAPINLDGNSAEYLLDTVFRNAGLYKFTVYVANAKGLESTTYIPILCDSISPAVIAITDSTGVSFNSNYAVELGQKVFFLFEVRKGELPLNTLRITNSINDDVESYDLTQPPYSRDSAIINYTSPPIIDETIFSFSATDSIGLEKKSQIKISIK